MKALQKSLLVVGGTVVGIAIAGGMFAYQDGRIGQFTPDESVKTAIQANDYSQLSTEAQAKITEDRFAKMVDRQATKKAVQTAIEQADYNAFLQVADEKILDRVDSQEDFDELVTRHQARTAHREALETAVKNNDFAAFDAAIESHKATMEAIDDDDDRHHNRPELTDEQKQEKFQKLVEYYTENGELPPHLEKRMGKTFGKHMRHDCDDDDDDDNHRSRRYNRR